MKKYLFSELSNLAKIYAVHEYLRGWLENHDDDELSYNHIAEMLNDLDDEYEINGNLIPDITLSEFIELHIFKEV